MYKAGIIPWRLADTIEGSCFVGISFFHEDEARSPFLRTSVAQQFSEHCEGFVLLGERSEWNPKDSLEKSPHLPEEQASKLLKQVLEVYEKQVGTYPRKVVLHKTSRYTHAPLPAKTVSTAQAGSAGKSQTFVSAQDIPAEWWTLFHSPALNEFIRIGLVNSPSASVTAVHAYRLLEGASA